MTREEAIDALWRTDHAEINAGTHEAVEMAIKLLRAEPCEDTISRQAVLDLVVANHTELNGLNVVMYSPYYKDIKQLPPVQPIRSKGEWIPVSERLPEDGKRVLITCDGLIRYVKQATYDEMRGGFYDTCAIKLESDEVIAWMPLPKPYQTESEDKNT